MKTNIMTSQLNELLEGKKNKSRDMRMVSMILFVILCAFIALNVNAQKYHGKFLNNVDANGVIINGYDPVAFFTDNIPVKGNPSISFNYQDATYHFASQEHLDLFKNNPEKYKPQFGAWCAYAVSLGRTAPIDVNTFSIVNGRLVIQHNQKAVRGWNEDVQGNLKLADRYWPKVTANGGKQIATDAKIKMILWISLGAVIAIILAVRIVQMTRRSKRAAFLKSKNPKLPENYFEEVMF
jgi:YHS domain-containing protein